MKVEVADWFLEAVDEKLNSTVFMPGQRQAFIDNRVEQAIRDIVSCETEEVINQEYKPRLKELVGSVIEEHSDELREVVWKNVRERIEKSINNVLDRDYYDW